MNNLKQHKRVIFITGMHRSGTSALAGAIDHCGIYGGQTMLEPAFDNRKGFFENQSAVHINDAILADWGLSWNSTFNLPAGWTADSMMQKHKNAIRHFLETELIAHSVIYVKDPRLCYLLPLWQEVLLALGIRSGYIISLRNPEEVQASLKRRNNLDKNKSCSLWLNHSLLAEKNTRNYQRLFVPYNRLLEAPVETAESILKEFQLMPEAAIWNESKKNLLEFLDKKLKHEETGLSTSDMGQMPYVTTVTGALDKLAVSPGDKAVLDRLDKVREEFEANLSFFTPDKKEEYFATLKAVSGKDIRMEVPLKLPVYQGLGKVVFTVNQMLNPNRTYRFFPSSDFCHVTLGEVSIKYEDGIWKTLDSCPKQVLLEHGNEFLFGKEDYLSVEPDGDKKPEQIRINIYYHHIGEGTFKSINNLGETIKNWFYGQLQEKEESLARHTTQWQEKETYFTRQISALLEKEESFILQISQWREKEASFIRESGLWQEKEAFFISQTSQLQEQLQSAIDKAAAVKNEAEKTALEFAGMRSSLEEKIKLLENEQNKTAGELRTARGTIEELKGKAAFDKKELESYRQNIKEKERQIWDVYSQSQKVERDYRQALKTLEEIRTSFSYRLGWILSAPLRFVYDLFSKKPVNETSFWLFMQFVITGLKMPGRMLSNINSANIKTLRKALANESPREIAGNLQKLLTGANKVSKAAPPPAPVTGPPVVIPPATVALAEKREIIAAPDKLEKPLPWEVDFTKERRKTVLFTSPNLPDFDGSSGGKRATRMLALLAESCEVYVFTLGNKPEKHVRKLEESGARVFLHSDFQEVKRLVPKVDVLIFSFFYTYFDCDKFLSLYPHAKIIVDSVDVHWVRHERSKGLWEELTDDIIRRKKLLEIEVYSKAAIIWTVTEEDRQAVLEEVPDADVRIVSNVHSPVVEEYKDPGNNNLLFFGGFAHYPNIIAVKELAMNIFPKIRLEVPDAVLVIAGSHAPQDVIDLGKLPGIEYLGFVEDSQLQELYRNSFLALAPLQTGAGIKGKICEAISYKVPVVTNSIGNEGIGLVNEKSGLISGDDEELVRMTVKALRREYDFKTMTSLAQRKLEKLVGPETVKKNMLDSFHSSEISICIVTWNKMKLLQRCIESIENHTTGIKYKILVYSNGCTDGTVGYLTAAAKINPNIVPIFSKTNDVFVIPNNRMMQVFPENDVVLLNNDTYVTEGWLEALQEAAYSSPEIGITGAKLLYPDGKLQEFGSELYADGTGRNIGKFDDPDREAYQHPKFSGYVSGCVFYIKRETIDKIGGFDEDFHPCYCEDSDYCYTAWEQGIATMVTPDCVVYHDEGSTSGKDVNTGFKSYQKVNFDKFLKKHGERLDEIATKIKLKNLTLQREYA